MVYQANILFTFIDITDLVTITTDDKINPETDLLTTKK